MNNKLFSEYIKQKIYLHRIKTYSEQQEIIKNEELNTKEELKEKEKQQQQKIENFRKLQETKKYKKLQEEKKNQEDERIREQDRIKQIQLSREVAIIKQMKMIKLYQEMGKFKQTDKEPKKIIEKQIKSIESDKKSIELDKKSIELDKKSIELEEKKFELEQKDIELENAKLIQQEIENEKKKFKQQENINIDLVIDTNLIQYNLNEDNIDTNLNDNNIDLVIDTNLIQYNLNEDNIDRNINDNHKNINLDLIELNNLINEPINKENENNNKDELEVEKETFIENHKNNKYEYLKNMNNSDYIRNVHIDIINQIKILKDYNIINKYFETLKKIHSFTNEHLGSDEVYLLEGYIVKKKCKNDWYGSFLFWNEVNALHKVSEYPHFPYLLSYDSKKLIIYMTYCGENLSFKNVPSDFKNQLNEIKTVMRIFNINSNDMIKRNICCLGNEIKIIDFGLSSNMFNNNITDSINKLESYILDLYKSRQNNKYINNIECTPYYKYYPNWEIKINMFIKFLNQLNPYKAKKTNTGKTNTSNNKIKRK